MTMGHQAKEGGWEGEREEMTESLLLTMNKVLPKPMEMAVAYS